MNEQTTTRNSWSPEAERAYRAGVDRLRRYVRELEKTANEIARSGRNTSHGCALDPIPCAGRLLVLCSVRQRKWGGTVRSGPPPA